jgi:hypothetical protein
MPSTLTPNARAPAGISSAASTVMSTAIAVEQLRVRIWESVYQPMLGASAVVALNNSAPVADQSRSRRRPRRSAKAMMATAKNTQIRAVARATLCGRSPWRWKSSDAYVIVCAIDVPM